MRYRVLLITILAACCSAEFRISASNAARPHDEQLSGIATAGLAISATASDERALSLLVNSLATTPLAPSYRTADVHVQRSQSGDISQTSMGIATALNNAHEDATSRITQNGVDSQTPHAFQPRDITLPIKISDVAGLSAG